MTEKMKRAMKVNIKRVNLHTGNYGENQQSKNVETENLIRFLCIKLHSTLDKHKKISSIKYRRFTGFITGKNGRF